MGSSISYLNFDDRTKIAQSVKPETYVKVLGLKQFRDELSRFGYDCHELSREELLETLTKWIEKNEDFSEGLQWLLEKAVNQVISETEKKTVMRKCNDSTQIIERVFVPDYQDNVLNECVSLYYKQFSFEKLPKDHADFLPTDVECPNIRPYGNFDSESESESESSEEDDSDDFFPENTFVMEKISEKKTSSSTEKSKKRIRNQ
jgi:hypothetical protein